MKNLCLLSTIVFANSCTLFNRNADDNELLKISEKVLNKKEGIDIIVQPIPAQKK